MTEQSYNILIVEDEALVAMALEIEIEDSGHRPVGPAARVSDALEILNDSGRPVDGAILDVMLGREEVFPVADRLKDMGVPFIFHSGHLSQGMIDGRYSVPCHSKPALPEDLIQSVVDVVSAKS